MASKVFAYTSTGTKFAANFMTAITSIRWVSKTASQDDHCQITDSASNVIYDDYATGADYTDSQRYEKQPMVNGIVVAAIDSGTVYIEVD